MIRIKAVICDIDGTLLQPDSGTIVKDSVANELIALQQQGIIVILASARIFQGVYPLAKQLQMDTYGGYIISCNGGYAFDVANEKKLFTHEIKKQDAFEMWRMCNEVGIDFAVSQPDCMIASAFSHGFSLDYKNCNIDYLITQHPEKHIHREVIKCSASGKIDDLDCAFPILKGKIEATFPYTVVRSTPYIIDIVNSQCGKANALSQLFTLISLSFDHVAAIGDGDSDAEMLRRSAFKATLKNGSSLCKQYADIIVDDCKQDGCLQFFQKIKETL